MTPRELHQLEQMQRCARLAADGEGHTPETRQAFRIAVAKRRWLDDAARADLFNRIASDDRPAVRN